MRQKCAGRGDHGEDVEGKVCACARVICGERVVYQFCLFVLKNSKKIPL